MSDNRGRGAAHFPSVQSGTEGIIMLAKHLQIKIPHVSSDLPLRRTKQYTVVHYQKNGEKAQETWKTPAGLKSIQRVEVSLAANLPEKLIFL